MSGVEFRGEPLKLCSKGAGVLMLPCAAVKMPARAVPFVWRMLNISTAHVMTGAPEVRKHLVGMHGSRPEDCWAAHRRERAEARVKLYSFLCVAKSEASIHFSHDRNFGYKYTTLAGRI